MTTARTKTGPAGVPSKRPAETGGVAGAFGLLVAHLLGVKDADQITAIGVAVGLIPAGITWLLTTIKEFKD